MTTKAALIPLVAAQLHQQVEKRGVDNITSGAIDLMVDNAVRIEEAIDGKLAALKGGKA